MQKVDYSYFLGIKFRRRLTKTAKSPRFRLSRFLLTFFGKGFIYLFIYLFTIFYSLICTLFLLVLYFAPMFGILAFQVIYAYITWFYWPWKFCFSLYHALRTLKKYMCWKMAIFVSPLPSCLFLFAFKNYLPPSPQHAHSFVCMLLPSINPPLINKILLYCRFM